MGNLFRMIGELCQQHCILTKVKHDIIFLGEILYMLQCGTFKMGTGTNTYCDFQCIIGCKDFLPNILVHVTTYNIHTWFKLLRLSVHCWDGAAALPSCATWNVEYHWPGSVDMTGVHECRNVFGVGAVTHAPLPHSSAAQLLTSDSADHGLPRIANKGVDSLNNP